MFSYRQDGERREERFGAEPSGLMDVFLAAAKADVMEGLQQ